MGNYDWNQIVADLKKYLHLMYTPVGMKWIRTEEELMAIPKVRIHEKHYAPCMVVGQALQFGWTSACKPENVHNNYCRGVHGLVERSEEWYTGEVFNGVWYGNAEAAKGHHAALNCVPSEYCAVVASPVDSGRLEPDVVVMYISSSQAFMLFAGYQFDKYEKLDFTFTGESTCSDSWTRTFMTGKPSLALPCFADRKFSGISEWELRVTLKPDDVLRCLDGLAKMHKNGLRHPIAPSSLTTDIIEGLPASYLKF